MSASHDVADLALAPQGLARIEWAEGQMPLLRLLRERFTEEQPLAGLRIAACLHVTAETGALVRTLRAGGAQVALCSSNPLTTQDDVAAALVVHDGAQVHARHGEDLDAYAAHVAALVAWEPLVTLDDGADLLWTLHEARPETAAALLGATEETTTGLVRLRRMHAEGRLRCPVVAVNEAASERIFNDRYGTGQSVLDGIVRATNVLLAGRTVAVLGYGHSGKGIALRAQGLGAQVIVCEVDPMRALQARLDGFEVMPSLHAAARGDLFITATGCRDVLIGEHFERMKDGALLANAGHFDVEISLAELERLSGGPGREVVPLVEQYEISGRRLNLLARGRVVNLAAARGHPAEVMDVSFAVHAHVVERMTWPDAQREPGVHSVPAEVDRSVALLKLAALGIEIDSLTPAQEEYLGAWARH